MNPYGNGPGSTAGGDQFPGLQTICFQNVDTVHEAKYIWYLPLLLIRVTFDDSAFGPNKERRTLKPSEEARSLRMGRKYFEHFRIRLEEPGTDLARLLFKQN